MFQVPSSVSFFIQGPATSSQLSLPDFTTVAELKERLYTITGITPGSQILACPEATSLNSDTAPLGTCNLDGHTLRVSTTDKALQHQLESYVDDAGADKFELTDQEYGARRDTVRAYKQRMGIGRFAPDAGQPKPHEPLPNHIHNGDRCEGGSGRRGTVGYVGYVPELPSHKDLVPVWVGVKWDEPVPASASASSSSSASSSAFGAALSIPAAPGGKSDGCVKGKRYFDCLEGFGSFVRPDRIEVGEQFAKEAWEDELEDL